MYHISVTIPVFNRAHLIGHTIDSVLSQTFQDYDVLVIDDASNDDTVAVVKRYCQQNDRIQLEINPQNLGLTRNWNRCLELARGPLVQIMQSDDLIDPDYLEKVSQAFETYPVLGLVAATCRYIDADGKVIHPGISKAPHYYCAGDEAVEALISGGWPHVSSIVFKRECYEKLGQFNVKIWHGPDGEFFTRLASRYDIYHFGEVRTSFRRHGSNMGVLEYLREDFLEVDMYKKRLTWGYLTQDGQRQLGVEDLEKYIQQDGANTALTGAILMIAYGRSALSRRYLLQALKLNPKVWHSNQFLKGLLLNIVPGLGRRFMEKRLQISQADQAKVRAVESSLTAIRV